MGRAQTNSTVALHCTMNIAAIVTLANHFGGEGRIRDSVDDGGMSFRMVLR